MVMGQFVTTYRKDYLWPYVKTLGLRPERDQIYQPRYRDDQENCACHCLPELKPTSQQRTILGPEALNEEQWSRLGPMGPLLDPKLFPAKVSAAPESKISRYNQPNVFLAKLQEKYPFIYECLRAAPPDDLISRINKDRLSTTYQVDYCKKREYPSAPYDELIRAAGVEGLPPCPEPIRLPGDLCRPIQKAMVTRRGGGDAGGWAASGATGGKWGRADDKQLGKHYYGEKPRTFEQGKPHSFYSPNETIHSPKFDKFRMSKGTDERNSCQPASSTSKITSWKPLNGENCPTEELINTWGQMLYRDTLHAHGGYFILRPKAK